DVLLNAFRAHYEQFQVLLTQVYTHQTDTYLLQLLGEDLNEFGRTVKQYTNIFEPQELRILQNGVQLMVIDVRALHEQMMESSHQGRPEVIHHQHTGHRGRPRIEIDRDFLQWAYTQRTTSALAHFLGINRDTIRQRLLEYGIASPGQNPFPSASRTTSPNTLGLSEDDILDAQIPDPSHLPEHIRLKAASIPSTLGYFDNNRGQTVMSLFLSA
ncbi:MAG: hypothetical protein NXY57DRAFT_879893, partial [Lentinula lateritia]